MSKLGPFFYGINIAICAALFAVGWRIGTYENERLQIVKVESTIVNVDHSEFVDNRNTYGQFAYVQTKMLLWLEFKFNGTRYRERYEFITRGITSHKVGEIYPIDVITKDGKFREFYSERYPMDNRIPCIFGLVVSWCVIFIAQFAWHDSELKEQLVNPKPLFKQTSETAPFAMCESCTKRLQEVNQ